MKLGPFSKAIRFSYLITAFSAALLPALAQCQDEVLPLDQLEVTRSGSEAIEFPARPDVRLLSLSRVYAGGFWYVKTARGESVLSVSVGGKYSTFSANVSTCVPASSKNTGYVGTEAVIKSADGSFSIEGDGVVMVHGSVTARTDPINIRLDISKVNTLTIRLSDRAILMEPLFSRFPMANVKSISLLSPLDGSTERGQTLSLKWSGGPEAKRYAIYLTATRDLSDTVGKTRAFVFGGSLPKLDVDASLLPDGSYTWQVIPLGDTGVSGPPSISQSFVLARMPPPNSTPTVGFRETGFETIDPRALWSFEWCGSDLNRFWVEIPRGASTLQITRSNLNTEHNLEIIVDGKSRYKGPDSREISLDLSGASSLAMTVDGRGAFGTAFRWSHPGVGTNDAPGDWYEDLTILKRKQVEAVSPQDTSKVPLGSVWFRWNALEGADHYELRLCPVRLDAPMGDLLPKVFPSSSNELTSDLSATPLGWYEWQVLAFSGDHVIGNWSSPLRFRLVKNK